MNRRSLGRTGVAVTEIGFGAASIGNLGQAVDDDTASVTVASAWDTGIRYFDTAPHYGLGLSERRLGAALAARSRSEFVVSTKVGRLLEPNPGPKGRDAGFDVPDTLRRRFDFTADGVRRSLESSLDRLRMDRVEIVYVHDPDTTEAVDAVVTEALPALARWRDEGVIDAIGVGVNMVSVALRLVRETAVDVIMIAGRWTLLDRSADRLLAECVQRQVSVVAAAPYNSGILARDRPEPGSWYDYAPANTETLARAREIADVCERFGVRLPSAALQFPLRHPAVVAVVAGLRTAREVAETTVRATTKIPGRLWELV